MSTIDLLPLQGFPLESLALPEATAGEAHTLTLELALLRRRTRHPFSGVAFAGVAARPAPRVEQVRLAAADVRPITLTFPVR